MQIILRKTVKMNNLKLKDKNQNTLKNLFLLLFFKMLVCFFIITHKN